MQNNSRGIIIICAILAAVGGWIAFRPDPVKEDYQLVSGVVTSATATSREGANQFTVRVWLEGQDTAYQLAAYVPGSVLGKDQIGPGAKVEMLALSQEIEKPSTGFFNNLDPRIESASLTVDGEAVSTWEDRLKHEQEQKKTGLYLVTLVPLLGGFIVMAQHFQNKKAASA